MHRRLYRWIDKMGFRVGWKIPWWVFLFWPRAHFCHEFDGLFVAGDGDEMAHCGCRHCDNAFSDKMGMPYD
jgi:hypothetical protein